MQKAFKKKQRRNRCSSFAVSGKCLTSDLVVAVLKVLPRLWWKRFQKEWFAFTARAPSEMSVNREFFCSHFSSVSPAGAWSYSPHLCHAPGSPAAGEISNLQLQVTVFFFLMLAQIRWTKTAGSASDRFQDSSVFNETLRIANIQRHQGGRYYCKAENGLGSPAIKSIRVDVYCK